MKSGWLKGRALIRSQCGVRLSCVGKIWGCSRVTYTLSTAAEAKLRELKPLLWWCKGRKFLPSSDSKNAGAWGICFCSNSPCPALCICVRDKEHKLSVFLELFLEVQLRVAKEIQHNPLKKLLPHTSSTALAGMEIFKLFLLMEGSL